MNNCFDLQTLSMNRQESGHKAFKKRYILTSVQIAWYSGRGMKPTNQNPKTENEAKISIVDRNTMIIIQRQVK